MKMFKKAVRWWRRSSGHKYINGGKGVISIFLACLMLPFLTLADYMVETARYHEAVQILNDAIDSGNLSVLANYDQYLFDRFGILGVSQTQSGQAYDTYINSNLSGIGAWTGVSASEQLQNPLSDADILKRQVLEASKISSPFALANDMALSQLVSKLEGLNDSLKDMTDLLDSYAKYTDTAETTVKGVAELNKCYKKLPKLEQTYHETYSSFKSAAQALIDYDPSEDEENEAENPLAQLEEDYNQAKDAYLSALTAFKEGLVDYHQSVSNTMDNANTLVKNAQDVFKSHKVFKDMVEASADSMNTDIQELDRQIASASDNQKAGLLKQKESLEKQRDSLKENKETVVSTVKAAAESFEKSKSEELKSYNEAVKNDLIKNLDACRQNVESLSPSTLQTGFDFKESNFYVAGNNLCASAGIALVQEVAESQFTDIISLAKAASASIKNLLTTNIMYNGTLDAVVSADMLSLDSESGWVDVMTSFQSLSENLSKLEEQSEGVLGKLNRIKNIILDAINLVKAIEKVVAGMVVRAIESVAEITQGQAGEKILISEYMTKSLANRTNKILGSDLFTGYKFSKVSFAKAKGIDGYGVGPLEDLSVMINTLKSMSKGGEDKIFCGAELEYILIGSSMEVANQAAVFLQIYFVRLLLDAVPVMTNKEVQMIAESIGSVTFGIGTVIVYIIELLVQPLIETTAIVNGNGINLWNTLIYLTPSGIVGAVGRLTSIQLTDAQKSNLKKSFEEVTNIGITVNLSKDKKGDLKDNNGYTWDYDNYCFVLLMLTGKTSTVMHRFANVMNMEANAYYGDGKFDIKESYTSVTGTVSGNYQIILPFDHLSDTGFGKVKKSRARSY